MKKLLFIALLLIGGLTIFAGCSKKNNEDGSPSTSISKSKLIGKWLYVKFVENGDTETFEDGEYFQLNEDGTAYDSMDNDNAQWSLSGNKITFIVAGKPNIATVEKLTSSELVMSTNDNGEVRTAYFKK
ncbi:lipocalin family protein [Mucilaginibacter rigui]|uniref:Lipocalin family protein n=1 Tax=Mucilaginibacter rigui TaxID=534635 RepID=A0ABR7X3X3_9SPHI|nr:lipocalin family protein [Mucilaginibacter rigui]MBD1385284.1 lipocalin family protein [Mucilaginibacter rigui]